MDGLHEQLEPGIRCYQILVPFLLSPSPPHSPPPYALLRESLPTGLAAVSDYECVSLAMYYALRQPTRTPLNGPSWSPDLRAANQSGGWPGAIT